MSAQQINRRPSEDATEGRNYTLAELRDDIVADRDLTLVVRAALGILLAVAVALVAAGLAANFVLALIGGGLGVLLFSAALVALVRLPSAPRN